MIAAAEFSPTVEVFADINCPFTHVGLKLVAAELSRLDRPVPCVIRAWPLEWVNGQVLDADAVSVKVAALRAQLGSDDFGGFSAATWPATTIPALSLAADAYERGPAVGLSVSLAIRDALFERGMDISAPDVLESIAQASNLDAPTAEPNPGVRADYEAGQRRGVQGSPHFFVQDAQFFCPSLDVGHDASGRLTASFDVAGLDRFMSHITDLAGQPPTAPGVTE